MVPIRGEGHIQDAPAYIPGLDALEFMKAAILAVIQSDCLVCVSGDHAELGNILPASSPEQTSLLPYICGIFPKSCGTCSDSASLSQGLSSWVWAFLDSVNGTVPCSKAVRRTRFWYLGKQT